MKLPLIVLSTALAGAFFALPSYAESPSPGDHGQVAFQYWCATCHSREPREGGRYLPGTASLRAKYGTSKPAALEDRTDLAPEFVKVVIRHGILGMPPFRKTEISDVEVQEIAAYLARNTH